MSGVDQSKTLSLLLMLLLTIHGMVVLVHVKSLASKGRDAETDRKRVKERKVGACTEWREAGNGALNKSSGGNVWFAWGGKSVSRNHASDRFENSKPIQSQISKRGLCKISSLQYSGET